MGSCVNGGWVRRSFIYVLGDIIVLNHLVAIHFFVRMLRWSFIY